MSMKHHFAQYRFAGTEAARWATLSGVDASRVQALVVRLKSIGVWDSLHAIYPLMGKTPASQAVNLKTPGTNPLQFFGSGTHTDRGYTPGAGNFALGMSSVTQVGLLKSFSWGVLCDALTTVSTADLNDGNTSSMFVNYLGSVGVFDMFDASNRIAVTPVAGPVFSAQSSGPANGVKVVYNNAVTAPFVATSVAQALTNTDLYLGNGGSNNYRFMFQGMELSPRQLLDLSTVVMDIYR